jgi:riboflavin kinase
MESRMNYRDLQILKEIALLGGLESYVPIRTRELAERIGVTQQSASRIVLNLLGLGLMERVQSGTRQSLKLTAAGANLLSQEYLDYVRIFEVRERLVFWGMVSSGFGEGHFFVARKGYQDQIENLFGFTPYAGTLNIQVALKERPKLKLLDDLPGIVLHGFTETGRTFGPVRCFRATLNDVAECILVRPQTGGHVDIVELVASSQLRESLRLEDGMWVTVEVEA